MADGRDLKSWKSGDEILSEDLQAFRDSISRVSPMSVGKGLLFRSSVHGGAAMSRIDPPEIVRAAALRVQVTTAPDPGLPMVAGVKRLLDDGSDIIGDEFYVRILKPKGHAVNDKFNVLRIANNTASIDVSGDPVAWQEIDEHALFAVYLTCDVDDDAHAGNGTTAPSFTYTVFDYVTDVQLATAQSPAWARVNGKHGSASKGTALVDASGALVLWQVDEVPVETTNCDA